MLRYTTLTATFHIDPLHIRGVVVEVSHGVNPTVKLIWRGPTPYDRGFGWTCALIPYSNCKKWLIEALSISHGKNEKDSVLEYIDFLHLFHCYLEGIFYT